MLAFTELDARGDLDELGEFADEADSVPCVALYALPGDDVRPTVDVDATDRDGTIDALAFTVRDDSADFETLGEPLEDADSVPIEPLTFAPADPVGGGDKLRALVAVAVEDAVLLLVGVWDVLKVMERDDKGEFETLGEALVVGVCVPRVAFTKGAPTDAVAPNDGVAVCDEVAVADALPVALAVRLPDGVMIKLEVMAAEAVPATPPREAL